MLRSKGDRSGINVGGLAGCSGGYFGQAPQNYTMNVIGTATGSGGAALQYVTTVSLTVR